VLSVTDRSGTPLRLLLVHAHPDDETTTTGSTIARYINQGVPVTLVTCTRGERGENALAQLNQNGLDGDAAAEELGEIRATELAKAAGELGLSDVRFLGGPGTWWDSGMADARRAPPSVQ
jgi:N-acetyl-1-D-myo-inositol-2-amino-2-deoxy-alpha-D-glucopyranoside deacetylase